MPHLRLLAATAIASGSIACKSRIAGLYSQRESRRKSPDRERAQARLLRVLATAIAVETFGMARHVVQTDAAQRQAKLLLSGRQNRKHDFGDEFGVRPLAGFVHRAGGAQNVVRRHAAAFTRQLITAMRATDALEDADAHQ